MQLGLDLCDAKTCSFSWYGESTHVSFNSLGWYLNVIEITTQRIHTVHVSRTFYIPNMKVELPCAMRMKLYVNQSLLPARERSVSLQSLGQFLALFQAASRRSVGEGLAVEIYGNEAERVISILSRLRVRKVYGPSQTPNRGLVVHCR